MSSRSYGPGTRLAHYVLIERIARGGMAEVYLARERRAGDIERLVALKLVLPCYLDDASFARMFVREARVAAMLDHPNVARVFDFGTQGDERYLAMEFVHGQTVRELLKNAPPGRGLPLEAALTIVLDVCAGLHHAHERRGLDGEPLKIVHRDISPSNLMVRYDGGVKILDFGIAKATSHTSATTGAVLKGKSGYMSPEQCTRPNIDRRSDIFSIGILLYELTTCRRAFFGDNPIAVINRIAKAEYAAPSSVVPGYPPGLEEVVAKAMQRDPDDRYQTAAELHGAVESFAQRHGVEPGRARLAEYMARHFGDVPYPVPNDAPREPSGTPAEAVTIATATPGFFTGRRRSRGRVAALAAAGAAGAVAASIFLLSSNPGAAPLPEPAAPAPTQPNTAVPPGENDAPVPLAVPASVTPDATRRVEPHAAAPPTGKPSETTRTKPRRKKPTKRKKARPKRATKPELPPELAPPK